MARIRPEEIEKEKLEQDMENYGDESYSGHAPTQSVISNVHDVDEMMEDVVGEDFDEDAPLNIADEIDDDEEDLQDKPINNYQPEEEEEDDEVEDSLLEVVREENVSEEDPMDSVSDDDFETDEEDQE